MAIKVLVAFSNRLFSEGVSMLLDADDDIEVTGVLEDDSMSCELVDADIILVDFTSLYNIFRDPLDWNTFKFILFDTACGEDNITAAIVSRDVKGLILGGSKPDLLAKAIQAVATGEVWLDKKTVKNIVSGMNALKKEDRSSLTKRETEIVALVAKGFKNKEVARKLFISEPTVKTHLYRIFQKLDIRSRPQLITYALKNPAFSSVMNQ